MYSLYWIKYQNYSNPKKDGYIGISSRPEERFIEHKKWSPFNPRLKRAINKGAEMEVLKENLSLNNFSTWRKRKINKSKSKKDDDYIIEY